MPWRALKTRRQTLYSLGQCITMWGETENAILENAFRPEYLYSLLSNHISWSTATLRSASRSLLHVPRTRTIYGSRAFSVAAPTFWNSLPADITNAASLTAFISPYSLWLLIVPPSSVSESSDLMVLYKLVFSFNFKCGTVKNAGSETRH